MKTKKKEEIKNLLKPQVPRVIVVKHDAKSVWIGGKKMSLKKFKELYPQCAVFILREGSENL